MHKNGTLPEYLTRELKELGILMLVTEPGCNWNRERNERSIRAIGRFIRLHKQKPSASAKDPEERALGERLSNIKTKLKKGAWANDLVELAKSEIGEKFLAPRAYMASRARRDSCISKSV